MNYEQRYKQALERAKSFELPEYKSIMASIFPELKENKDEKWIPKEIIKYLKEKGGFRSCWIAWLEKQGEQKPAECNNSILKNKLLELFQRFRWYCKDKILTNGDIIDYVDAHIQELIDTIQKPAWSEEDDNIKQWIISDIEKLLALQKKSYTIADKEINWLKSLRPQPNYIQTKTDSRIRHEIINYLDCQKRKEPTRKEKHDEWIEWLISKGKLPITMQQDNNWIERIEDILDWAEEKGRLSLSDCQDYSIMLSSFKHQNRWRPSDEQIKVCKEVYADILSAKGFDLGTVNSELNRLEEQFKKLREE